MGKLVSPQVNHKHRNVPQQKLFVSRIFLWLDFITQDYDEERNMLIACFDEGSHMPLTGLQSAEFGLNNCCSVYETVFSLTVWHLGKFTFL